MLDAVMSVRLPHITLLETYVAMRRTDHYTGRNWWRAE